MSDGTTAIQVSPIPTESEMNGFRQMLDRALNAIVQASELAKVVDSLKVEVAAFQHDMESQRKRNQELDEMLHHVRAQRDKAEAELSETKARLNDSTYGWEAEIKTRQGFEHEVTNLKHELEQLKNTLAAEQDARTEAELYREQAETKLANIQSLAMDMFGLKKPAEPVQPTPPLTVSQIEEVKPENAHAEQAQASEAKRVYEDEPNFNWSKPYDWDTTRNARYQYA